MSKPGDIPQDVWEIAWKLQGDTRYDVVAFTGGSTEELLQVCEDDAADIARAILAAKAEEREACAALVEDQDSWTSRFETSAAIRKRSDTDVSGAHKNKNEMED